MGLFVLKTVIYTLRPFWSSLFQAFRQQNAGEKFTKKKKRKKKEKKNLPPPRFPGVQFSLPTDRRALLSERPEQGNFGLESRMVFEATTGVYERIYRFNSK